VTAARRTIDLAITEAELQALVVDLAHTYAWRVMHVRPSRVAGDRWATATSIHGWPDLTLLGHGRALFVELKSETGRLSPDQREVIGHLRAAGLDARIWTPSSWAEIEATLTGGRT
jgi:hypothetical protein